MSGGEAVAWLSLDHAVGNWFKFVHVSDEGRLGLSAKEWAQHLFASMVESGDYEQPELVALYSQATVDTLRAQLEAAEAEVAKLSSANVAYSQQVNELIGRAGNAEARAEAAEAECARISDELVRMRDSWVVPTSGKPSSRRIATINEAETMRAEDDFDNEVWARRKCATDIDKIIHRLDAARTKEQEA